MAVHKNIRLLYWFNFFTDFDPLAPIAAIYFAQVSGSFALGMSVFSIQMISAAAFEVPTGIFSDRIGRKMTIVLGSLCHVIAYLFIAIGGSFMMLAIGAVIAGLGRSFYSGNNQAFLYDTLLSVGKEKEYGEYLGKSSAMFQAALAVSALLGSAIAFWSITAVVWVSIIPKIIRLLITFHFEEPRTHSKKSGNVFEHLSESLKQFQINAKLRWMSIASLWGFAVGESLYLFRAAFYQTVWPVWAIGFASVIANINAAVGYWISGRMMRKFRPKESLVSEILINRLISFPALLFPTVFTPILLSFTSFFFGVNDVIKGDILQKEFTQAQRATLGSVSSFFGSIFFALMAFGIGFIGDMLGPRNTLIFAQFLFLPILFFYWKFFQEERKKEGVEG